jgi:HD-GYP domain-containing protein (c-di-GMP phosphodiesterase class II)
MKEGVMTLADDDPYVEQLYDDAPDFAAAPLPRREVIAEVALGALLIVAVVALALAAPSDRHLSVVGAIALVGAFVVAQQVQFEMGIGYTVPTELVLVPMLILAPPALVPLLVAAGLLIGRLPSYLRRQIHPSRAVFVLPDAWYAFGAALLMATLGPVTFGLEDWPVLALALVAQAAFDAGITGLRIWLSRGVPPSLQLRAFAWVLAVDAALAPLGLLAGVAAQDQPLAVALVLPMLALLALFARERREHIDKALALSHAYRGTALLMSDVLEADDAYTGGEHSHGVVALALEVGDALGVDGRERRNLEFGALLHDVGKIRVADEIINKPGKLTDAEFALITRHPIDGQEMLERVGGVLAEVGLIVHHHHERWDGGGYPDGIAGDAIPLAARVICACDAYSAMTTNRPYRAALPASEAIDELRRCAGAQFDPAVVEALVGLVARKREPRPARALLELVA